MKTYLVYNVFYSVPGQYTSSTEVRATSKEEAAAIAERTMAGGRAKVTAVFNGR